MRRIAMKSPFLRLFPLYRTFYKFILGSEKCNEWIRHRFFFRIELKWHELILMILADSLGKLQKKLFFLGGPATKR